MEGKKPVIRRASEAFVAWCADPSPAARFERTIAQGVVGVGVACLAGLTGLPDWAQFCAVPLVMAVLAPVQAEIGRGNGDA